MFTQILNTSVHSFDGDTGRFLGEARLTPTEESAASILEWFNYGVVPQKLTMLDSSFEPSENYVDPIVPNVPYSRRGIFRALIKDEYSKEWIPVEAHIVYTWRTRSTEMGNTFASVEFDNIKVDSSRTLEYG